MTDTDYEILSFLSQRPSCLWSAVLNAFDPVHRINEVNCVLFDFLDCGWIEKRYPAESPPKCRIRLSPDGYRVLHLHDVQVRNEQKQQEDNDRILKEKAAAKEAERTSDQKFQVRLSVLQALLSLLGSILSGAVLGNLDRISILFSQLLDAVSSFVVH